MLPLGYLDLQTPHHCLVCCCIIDLVQTIKFERQVLSSFATRSTSSRTHLTLRHLIKIQYVWKVNCEIDLVTSILLGRAHRVWGPWVRNRMMTIICTPLTRRLEILIPDFKPVRVMSQELKRDFRRACLCLGQTVGP
jgi:hypothetical protein